MIPYFAQLNHELPMYINPADFAIDLTSIDLRNQENENSSRIRVDQLIIDWGNQIFIPKILETTIGTPLTLKKYKKEAAFRIAYPILVERSMKNILRQPGLASARILQVMALALIFSIFFARLKNTQQFVIARIGILVIFPIPDCL